MKNMKEQLDAEQNPYETPGIGRLHHTSVYVWPLAMDRSLSFNIDIDELQLKKSVECNSQFVNGNCWALCFCVFFFAVFMLFGSISSINAISLFFGIGSFAALCFTLPRCFYGWHARRLKSNFYWLWGHAQISVSSEGVRWESGSVSLLIHWDSFHTVRFASDCVWLSTFHPFAIELPIHRSWVDDSTWKELHDVFSAHTGFFDVLNFWRYHRPKLVSFDAAGAPELQQMEVESIPFRARDNGQGYASESVKSFFGYAGLLFLTIPIMHFASAFFPQLNEWDDATIGFRKRGLMMYVVIGFALLQLAIRSGLRWFPAGIHWYQWSQAQLSSQSGYVSQDAICIASPAYQLTAKLDGRASVRLEKDYLVLDLKKNARQSLVIPKDQFNEADANKAWLLFQ
jgi:hypothetical protein